MSAKREEIVRVFYGVLGLIGLLVGIGATVYFGHLIFTVNPASKSHDGYAIALVPSILVLLLSFSAVRDAIEPPKHPEHYDKRALRKNERRASRK
jgi:purine-cytosine permease-like protein